MTTVIKIVLACLPESLWLFVPPILWAHGVVGAAECAAVTFSILLLFIYSCNRDVVFTFLDKDDGKYNLVIAPEESASKYAKLFLQRIFEYKPFTKHEYKYAALGTSSLSRLEHVELVYDISHEVVWGLPKLSQMISFLLIYYKLACYVIKHKDKVHSIIFYSNPDLVHAFLPFIKRYASNIKCLVIGLPEKDIVLKKIGDQTKSIIENSDKVILNMFGGSYTEYYQMLKEQGLWDDSKMTHCQSSYIMDYIVSAGTSNPSRQAADVVLLLGSRAPEINTHEKIARRILKSSLSEHVVLLAANEQIHTLLTSKFPGARIALDGEYDFANAKLAICKSGVALIKPILYGIPTIPFYMLNFRTFWCIWFYQQIAMSSKRSVSRKDFILPYLVTKNDFLPSEFFGFFCVNKLIKMAEEYYSNPPDMEAFRILFARNYLELDRDYDTFKGLVDDYLNLSRRELITNLRHIEATFPLSPEMKAKVGDIEKLLKQTAIANLRPRQFKAKVWSIFEELRDAGDVDDIDYTRFVANIQERYSTEVKHIYDLVA